MTILSRLALSMSQVRHCAPDPVSLKRAGTVDGGEAEAAADDKRVPPRAGVEGRERVAHRLHRWWCQGCALAYVEALQSFIVILTLLHG